MFLDVLFSLFKKIIMNKPMYQVINNLPIDYDFQSKTKEELKLYAKWFEENKESRLQELIKAVKTTKGYENWEADYSPESLKMLGKWFEENVETEKLSEEEYKEKRAAVPDEIEIKDWDITIKTRSLAVDIGIYFGEVFIKNHEGLKWEQYFSRSKYDMDKGHMVIKGFGKTRLNSIWKLYIIANCLADKTDTGEIVYELYTILENKLDEKYK